MNVCEGETEPHIHVEALQDILESVPSWTTRWGVTAIGGVLFMLLGVSWFVRYPDVTQARVVIMSENPPVPVVARTDGRIVRLLVRDGARVAAGERLAVLESPADPAAMFALQGILDEAAEVQAEGHVVASEQWPSSLELGELRAPYASFLQHLEDWNSYVRSTLYAQRRSAIRSQIEAYERLSRSVRDQDSLRAEALRFQEQQLEADQRLLERGMISAVQVREDRHRTLDDAVLRMQNRMRAFEADTAIADFRRNLLEIDQEQTDRERTLQRNLRESLQTLKQGVVSWQHRYVLTAPVPGVLSLFDVWAHDQFVRSGKESMFVVPDGHVLVGRMVVAQQGVGRVRAGQRVTIGLDTHPPQQFGSVRAEVKAVSNTARDDDYVVTLALPDGVRTSFHHEVSFTQGMSGQASILTRERRLLERLVGPLRILLENAFGRRHDP